MMKLALCNEVIRELSFPAQCELTAKLGYSGIEIAPFTLFEDRATFNEQDAALRKQQASDAGIVISSLHWLLVKPNGLSLVSRDASVRLQTQDWLKRVIAYAHACGATVLVHGSPKQRSPENGQTVQECLDRVQETLALLEPFARQAGVAYCLEPLSPFETPVVNTVEQASQLVDAIQSPYIRTMLDASASTYSESLPMAEVFEKYFLSGHIAHVQVNDHNRKGPGQGDTNLLPLFQKMKSLNYQGWVAVEPFIYEPDGPGCAAFSAGYVQGLMKAVS
jgi:sugar phosphate isomerase/epimerase